MSEKDMKGGFAVEGLTIAPGVVETIISLAAAEVDGVAGVGNAGPISSIRQAFNAGKAIPTGGITVTSLGGNKASVELTIQAHYGYRLVAVAADVRQAVADALAAQIGVEVTSVDIFVDGLAFAE